MTRYLTVLGLTGRWIEVPQGIEPGTAIPNLGVSEGQARSIAEYLYTLR